MFLDVFRSKCILRVVLSTLTKSEPFQLNK